MTGYVTAHMHSALGSGGPRNVGRLRDGRSQDVVFGAYPSKRDIRGLGCLYTRTTLSLLTNVVAKIHICRFCWVLKCTYVIKSVYKQLFVKASKSVSNLSVLRYIFFWQNMGYRAIGLLGPSYAGDT